ncbi:MAG: TonB family protein [Candidatus Acidiferrales bacterium]
MKPRMVLTFVSCLLAIAVPIVGSSLPKPQAAAPSSYANSTDGLQKLVWDMVAAEKSNGEKALAPYLQSLTFSDSAAWFSAVFGESNGQQLAVYYDAWAGARNFQIAGDVARAIASQMTDVAALSFERGGDPGTTDKDDYFLGLVKQPQTFYVVNFKSEDGSTMRWAYFVYDAGAFRYLGPLADLRLVAASTSTGATASLGMPRRIHIAGGVVEAHIANRVPPVYPQEALTQRLEGTVELHTLIAPDGTVQSVDATSGNPVLVEAAEAAVRQWRFNPVLVNGEAVTVDTTLTVEFHLPQGMPAAAGQPGASGAYAPIPSYPDSPGGLTKMMKQMLDMAQHGKLEDLQPYFHALLLPNPESWFSAQFGAIQGTSFTQSYQNMEQSLPMLFANTLQSNSGMKFTSVEVQRFRSACTVDANELEYPVLAAREQQSTQLYEVRFVKDTSFRWLFPFAYVDGGFRYLGDLQVKQPDNRVYGDSIQWPKLIHEVAPTYPNGFNRPNNSGLVKLWGTIGIDGSVSDLHVIEGTCPYVEATIEAVKKWRFTPLMVDGKAQATTYPFQYSYGPGR